METLVLKMTFLNEQGEKGIVSIKDVSETLSEADVSDLMDLIITTGFLIKNSRATDKESAQTVKTIIQDIDILS
jgi:hypothetical protein